MDDLNWCFCGKATTNGAQLYCSDTCLRSDGYSGPCASTTHSLNAQQMRFTNSGDPRVHTQSRDKLVYPLSPAPATNHANAFAHSHYNFISASNLIAPKPQRHHRASSSGAMYSILNVPNHSGSSTPMSSPPRQSCSPVASRDATFLSPGRVSSILGHFEEIAEQQQRLRSR
ncbi:hypothetical protein HDU77_006689 [Chytriomyces hyalinus]|nr:hypothetical protein HDU77_006689 [Chytriomyces hyalinus]